MTPGRLCMWQLLKVKQEIIVGVLMSYSGQCVCVSDVCVCVFSGHAEVVRFLLEACKVNPIPKDR